MCECCQTAPATEVLPTECCGGERALCARCFEWLRARFTCVFCGE